MGGERVRCLQRHQQSQIDYRYDEKQKRYAPVIGNEAPLFGKALQRRRGGKLVTWVKKPSRPKTARTATPLLGNGAYYAPDLTKAWLDPSWIDAANREKSDAGLPQRSGRQFPQLRLAGGACPIWDNRRGGQGVVAFLKWMSAIDTNGFPNNFKTINAKE